MASLQVPIQPQFHAQPLMAQPVPLEDVSAEVVPEVPRPEARLREAVAGLAPESKKSVISQAEQLAILKRWYYRGSRTGEIFFADGNRDLPMRRIVRGIGRVYRGEAPESATVATPVVAAQSKQQEEL